MSANAATTGLSITNPLVKYRALVATKAIRPDSAQHRLALHLQKLYERLKDYEPELEYSHRLDQISRAVNAQQRLDRDPPGANAESPSTAAAAAGAGPGWRSGWRTFLAARSRRDSLALTRRLTSHEAALQLTSPRGLMLHGEVGTGKSMLVDLFADCLPNRKKRRRHFNTFMLETFAKLEALRRSRRRGGGGGGAVSTAAAMAAARGEVGLGGGDDEHSLLWLAKDMIHTSPILFLDEFQMPDRVASKILTTLMTSFFQLGGVLVATSNRMPEELAKAAGIAYAPPPTSGWGLGWFGQRRGGLGRGVNEFAAFLEVLKARCEVWEMEGGKDYRRLESGAVDAVARQWEIDGQGDYQHSRGMAGWPVEAGSETEGQNTADAVRGTNAFPPHYCVNGGGNMLSESVAKATGELALGETAWSPAVMTVYGRVIEIPQAYKGVTKWSFHELCKATLGPADYITLASKYHTLILTDVPVMNWMLKNEARRLITLLDALYECRCKLFVSAAAGPDDIFFPDEQKKKDGEDDGGDAVYPETLSEVYQDATAPFRPNILTENPNYAEPDPEPDFTHARLVGLLRADSLEDDPPSNVTSAAARKQNPFGRSFGMTDAELMERKPVDPDDTRHSAGARRPNFQDTSAFTGQDERFAYKRAQSRLWEMCSERWWARDEPDWHRPLPQDVRKWEDTPSSSADGIHAAGFRAPATDVRMGGAAPDETRDARSFKLPQQ